MENIVHDSGLFMRSEILTSMIIAHSSEGNHVLRKALRCHNK